jgi:hypothetical protein
LSVGAVVVGAGVVVVVLAPVVVVEPDPPVEEPDAGALVVVVLAPAEDPDVGDVGDVGDVVVVAGVVGATNGTVSPRMVARMFVGVVDRLVQLRAAFQLAMAVVAGAPVSGCGTPLRIVAGRQTAPLMWRPCAVMMSVPLSVSGAVSS